MNSVRPLIAILVFASLAGCEQQAVTDSNADPVLAKVGASLIHQSQFDVMMDKISPGNRAQDNKPLRDKILQGLVRTRVLAITAEQQMSKDDIMILDARVLAYRDELLAQNYIQKNIVPEPVTPAMVNQYYEEHLDDYSVPGRVGFEYLATTVDKLDDDILGLVVEAFSKTKNIRNWKEHADNLKRQNMPVEYKSALMLPTSIDLKLRDQISRLQIGAASDIIYGDKIYVVRLLHREADQVKPVYAVSVEIRKKLAPVKLKQQLTLHIDQAQKNLLVELVK
jgi:hypothetical protein